MAINWKGVMPAITTCFREDLSIDHEFFARHCKWLVDSGCTGIITPGSLGEGATLGFDEKLELWQTCVASVGDRVPVVAAISALTTGEAVALAKKAAEKGCRGLMVLPPFFEDTEMVRPFFSRLRKLRDELQAEGLFGQKPGELSMGMTHDFEVAIEEGATMLRIGTAIFGERQPRAD